MLPSRLLWRCGRARCRKLASNPSSSTQEQCGCIMAEIKTMRSYALLGHLETAIYSVLGLLMAFAGVLAILGALPLFMNGIRDFSGTSAILQLIDQIGRA